MAYGKLIKTCQDYALGIGQVNQARDNLASFRTAWIAEHGKEESVGHTTHAPTNPYTAFGHHNTPPIPRASVFVDVIATIGGAPPFTVSAQSMVLSVSRISTGLWFIALDGRLTIFWANAFPSQASADIRLCKPTSYFPTTAGTPPGIYVKTQSSTAGSAFAAADFSFDCTIYGYNASDVPVAAAASAGNVAKSPGKFTRGPPFRRGPFNKP